AEDDRRDDHFHELDEAIAQGLHGRAGGREQGAQQHAQRNRDNDLEVERLSERTHEPYCTIAVSVRIAGRMLYHADYYRWTQVGSERLRRGEFSEVDV